MHHVMLHKSSENVDVTYKVDVKFNVIGPRMKSSIASSELRHEIRYVSLSHDVLISINWFCATRKERERERELLRIYRATENPTRVTLHPRDEKPPGSRLPLRNARWERAIYVRSRSTCLRRGAQGALLNNRITEMPPIYTPVNRIL